jgi:Spy/CpxP family protein refolding chaperone
MTRVWRRAALATVWLVALAVPLGAQSFAWWKSDAFQKEVGLTPDQCTRIDAVFQATLPKLRQGRDELDRQEAELSRLIESNADEASVTKQIDRVEAIRASTNKERTLMLFHMHQVLTPDQVAKFKTAHDRWVQEHRKPQGAKSER